MGPRSSPASRSLDTDLSATAGLVAILREAVGLVTRAPAVVGVYVVVALVTLVSDSLGNFAGLLGGAVAVVVAYRALDGRPVGDVSFGIRLLVVLVAGLIAGIVILIGLVLLVVPGLYLVARLRLVTATVMLEDAGPVEALGRSFELTEGHALTVFVVASVPALVAIGLGGALVLQSGALTGGGVDIDALRRSIRLADAASALLVSPVAVAADALMYGLYGPDETGGGTGAPTESADEGGYTVD